MYNIYTMIIYGRILAVFTLALLYDEERTNSRLGLRVTNERRLSPNYARRAVYNV